MSNIQTSMKIEDVKDIRATMSITMSVGDWIDLQVQIKDQYPGWVLSGRINDIVRKVTESFYAEIKKDGL